MIRVNLITLITLINLLLIPIKIVSGTFTHGADSIHYRKECHKLHSSRGVEDLYGAIHRKEYEITQLSKQHKSTSDPVRMAMGYLQENTPPLMLARALRRVYEDPNNTANPDCKELSEEEKKAKDKFGDNSMAMRRGCFIADIKRKSLSSPGQTYINFNDASIVAKAMVEMGADCVFVNVDYAAYGGDIDELRSSINAVRKVSDTAAVVMKDIVVDELQIGLAKEAGADGILLIASVLGPALENFLNLCSIIGLEAIVECHTRNEVEAALSVMAQNILVTNFDRISGNYFPDQAINLAGLFPGSGGPIISLATGGIETIDDVRKHLNAGYDGVVVGKAIMGNMKAPGFIKAVREKPLLPVEFSGWGLDDYDFDMEGNVLSDDLEK